MRGGAAVALALAVQACQVAVSEPEFPGCEEIDPTCEAFADLAIRQSGDPPNCNPYRCVRGLCVEDRVERCDLRDNDCDSIVDEGLPREDAVALASGLGTSLFLARPPPPSAEPLARRMPAALVTGGQGATFRPAGGSSEPPLLFMDLRLNAPEASPGTCFVAGGTSDCAVGTVAAVAQASDDIAVALVSTEEPKVLRVGPVVDDLEVALPPRTSNAAFGFPYEPAALSIALSDVAEDVARPRRSGLVAFIDGSVVRLIPFALTDGRSIELGVRPGNLWTVPSLAGTKAVVRAIPDGRGFLLAVVSPSGTPALRRIAPFDPEGIDPDNCRDEPRNETGCIAPPAGLAVEQFAAGVPATTVDLAVEVGPDGPVALLVWSSDRVLGQAFAIHPSSLTPVGGMRTFGAPATGVTTPLISTPIGVTSEGGGFVVLAENEGDTRLHRVALANPELPIPSELLGVERRGGALTVENGLVSYVRLADGSLTARRWCAPKRPPGSQ